MGPIFISESGRAAPSDDASRPRTLNSLSCSLQKKKQHGPQNTWQRNRPSAADPKDGVNLRSNLYVIQISHANENNTT